MHLTSRRHSLDLGNLFASPLARRFIQEIGDYPRISLEEEGELGAIISNPDSPQEAVDAAVEHLTTSNLRLVPWLLSTTRVGVSYDIEDRIGEANLALFLAAKSFDPARGRFGTFAVSCILNALRNALNCCQNGSIIAIPTRVLTERSAIYRAYGKLAQRHKRQPLREEIAEEAETPMERMDTLDLLPFSEGEDGAAGICDPEEPHAIFGDKEEFHAMCGSICAALESFKDQRKSEFVRLYFGFGGNTPLTLEEIGGRQNPPISRERVRQVLEATLCELRKRFKGLEGFLYFPATPPEAPLTGPTYRVLPPVKKPRRVYVTTDQVDSADPLSVLCLPARAYHCLTPYGVMTVGDLQGLTREDIMEIKGMGETTLDIIVSRLERHGLSLLESDDVPLPENLWRFPCTLS